MFIRQNISTAIIDLTVRKKSGRSSCRILLFELYVFYTFYPSINTASSLQKMQHK